MLGAIVGLVAVVLIALNLYVQSAGTQLWVQSELSRRLGTTVRIASMSVTPWGGLTLSGITMPQSAGGPAPDFLRAQSFHLHVRFLPLLQRRFVIKKVALIGPTVVWRQNEQGKWRLPGAERPPAAAPPQVPTIASSPLQAPVSPPPGAHPQYAPGKSHFVPEVRKLSVSGGRFQFVDRHGATVAIFDGVNFASTMQDPRTLRGTARVAKISVRDRFVVTTFRSPVRYEHNALELPKISSRLANGTITGHLRLETQAVGSPFDMAVKFQNVRAEDLVAQAGASRDVVKGRLEGKFEGAGEAADPNTLNGHGEILLRDGELQQYSLLVALGQVLQIDELTRLHLNEARAKYHLAAGFVTVDELVLRSPNIRLSATGTIGLDGKLRLDSQLAINEKVRDRLFSPIRDNFQPIDEPGYSAIAFNVNGTIDRPSTNLLDRMIGRDLKDLVRGLFGKKPKKKKPGEAGPAESEEPNASPPPAVDPAAPSAAPSLAPPP